MGHTSWETPRKQSSSPAPLYRLEGWDPELEHTCPSHRASQGPCCEEGKLCGSEGGQRSSCVGASVGSGTPGPVGAGPRAWDPPPGTTHVHMPPLPFLGVQGGNDFEIYTDPAGLPCHSGGVVEDTVQRCRELFFLGDSSTRRDQGPHLPSGLPGSSGQAGEPLAPAAGVPGPLLWPSSTPKFPVLATGRPSSTGPGSVWTATCSLSASWWAWLPAFSLT